MKADEFILLLKQIAVSEDKLKNMDSKDLAEILAWVASNTIHIHNFLERTMDAVSDVMPWLDRYMKLLDNPDMAKSIEDFWKRESLSIDDTMAESIIRHAMEKRKKEKGETTE